MNEVKGLLWYLMSQTTLIAGLLLLAFGVNFKLIIVIMFFAGFYCIMGFLHYFGIIDKIKRRKEKNG
jgi:uncharacterized membrane protein